MMSSNLDYPVTQGLRGTPLAYNVSPPTIRIHRSFEAAEDVFRAIEPHAAATIFQSIGWLTEWFRWIAPARNLSPCIVEVRSPANVPLMLLPLVVERRQRMSVVCFADAGVSDYNAPLLHAEFAVSNADFKLIWRDIRNAIKTAFPAADTMILEKMPGQIAGRPNPLVDLPGVLQESLMSSGVAIAPPFDRWQETTLAPKFHQDMIAKTRKMGKAAKVRFSVADTEDEADRIFAALREQRRERFTALARDEILDEDAFAKFYRGITAPTAERGGRLFALYGDAEIAATGLAMVNQHAIHMLMVSHKSERWRNYSPGIQLFLNAIRWGCDQHIPFFDFTTGGESYKVNFGTTASPLFQLTEGLSFRGRCSAMTRRLVRTAKNEALRWGLKKKRKRKQKQ